MTEWLGEYRAQSVPAAWLNDPAIRHQIEQDLYRAARDNQGPYPYQTTQIIYREHVDPKFVTPTIQYTNHE